jgi:hypothetical protein
MPAQPDPMSSEAMRVHLFPRRKAGDTMFPEKGRLPVKVDRETIQTMFGMPQPDASRALGVSLTALKQVCRKLGITRWPYQRPCKRGKRYRSRIAPASSAVPAEAVAARAFEEAIVIHDICVTPVQEHDDDDDRKFSAATTPVHTTKLLTSADDDQECFSDATESCYSSAETSTSPNSSPECSSPVSPAFHDSEGVRALGAHPGGDAVIEDNSDHDLGWLVDPCNTAEGPDEEEWAFEMVWRERCALEAQMASTQAAAGAKQLAERRSDASVATQEQVI